MRNKARDEYVILCDDDYAYAAATGRHRYMESRRLRLYDRSCGASVEKDTQGAAAEIAFAIFAGALPLLLTNSFHAADVCGIQVRSTPRANGGLIVRKGDPLGDPYVLMIGEGKQWKVAGWLMGEEVQRVGRHYVENGREACFIASQSSLRPISALMAMMTDGVYHAL